MSTEEFRHERLKLSGSFMRLLQIQGGTKKDALSLRITQYAIHRRPSYVAISYTWGNAADTHFVRVNGRPFRVRSNLWHLLYHLRQRGVSQFLWIDALCIDQANLEERNFHVQLMGEIYDSADRTIVWLGLPSEDRRQARAMEFVGEMAATIRGKQGTVKFRDVYLSDKYAARWMNLVGLCYGVYWTRTWIIQEFLQAKEVEVVCGTASLDWKDFEDVVRALRAMDTPVEERPAFLDLFVHTLPVRLTARRISHTESTLEELLAEFYDSKCAERRDKVYGMLGIADDCGENENGAFRGPRPDYSKNIVEVFFEVFRYLSPSEARKRLSVQGVCLALRALGITQADVEGYVASCSGHTTSLEAVLSELRCPLIPDYVNIVDEVLPGWTSIRDLRRRLDQVDWAKYVGHEVKRKVSRSPADSLQRTGSGGRQTEYVRSPLPADLIENVVQAASQSEDLLHLYNYPLASECVIPLEDVLLHEEDKRRVNNEGLTKPSIVIESNPDRGVDPLRLGFACTDVRAGDMIFQFRGVDIAVIARRVAGGLKIVGRARMTGHLGLREEGVHSGCRGPGGGRMWSGLVRSSDGNSRNTNNEDEWTMQTDPISLWELLAAG
ncbi:hypothetical protein PV11_00597 [Exophiala sideris]|uniref:Heterokaryon incompatibility domain-containing protein n=1 Tax=Exophiala sideris TaxID=1016849 RepID=A0A0D1ZDH2_9EURO|nr:hypothetical protein PV11_00597 [Exophiala sideris]